MGKQCMYVCMPMGWTDKEGRWYILLMGKQCMYYTHGNHYSVAVDLLTDRQAHNTITITPRESLLNYVPFSCMRIMQSQMKYIILYDV